MRHNVFPFFRAFFSVFALLTPYLQPLLFAQNIVVTPPGVVILPNTATVEVRNFSQPVTLQPDGGNAVVTPLTALSFSVSDSVIENVSFQVINQTDGNTIGYANISFGTFNFENSGVTTPSSALVGETFNFTVVLMGNIRGPDRRITLQPLAGKQVMISQTGSSVISPSNSVITNENGEANFRIYSTTAETVTYTVQDVTDGITLLQKPTITFHFGGTNPDNSTLTAMPDTVPANNSDFSLVSVQLSDDFGNPVEGKRVMLTQDGNSTIEPVNPVSNANGIATFQVRNENEETVTYRAVSTDADPNGLVIRQSITTALRLKTPVDPSQLPSAARNAVVISQPVQVHFFASPATPKDFTGRIEKNRFATQTDTVHVLTWQDSESPLIVSYNIYENGRFVKSVLRNAPSKVFFYNRRPHRTYVYRLVAVNTMGRESAPVTVTLPKPN